jgi:diacylglycerol kinase (ATP)
MKHSSERILVIFNPAAGSGLVSKDIATSIIFKRLRQHFGTVSLINTNSQAHAAEIISQTMDQFDVFVAFGGDGTINSVAHALIHTNKVLGILPGGSGNGLVRNLHIPLSWRRAIDTLINGHDAYIDTGMINQRFFLNVAGIGLDGYISKKFNEESKSRGILPYVYYAVKGYYEMPDFRVQITVDDAEFEETIFILACANFRQYGGNAIIAPHASAFDRQLDLCLLNKFKLLKSSFNIQRLFTGTIDKFPFYKSMKFENLHIKSLSGQIPYMFDGEYSGQECEEFDIMVQPASLKVRIPKIAH